MPSSPLGRSSLRLSDGSHDYPPPAHPPHQTGPALLPGPALVGSHHRWDGRAASSEPCLIHQPKRNSSRPSRSKANPIQVLISAHRRRCSCPACHARPIGCRSTHTHQPSGSAGLPSSGKASLSTHKPPCSSMHRSNQPQSKRIPMSCHQYSNFSSLTPPCTRHPQLAPSPSPTAHTAGRPPPAPHPLDAQPPADTGR